MVNVSSGKSEVDRITFYDSKIGATAIQHSDERSTKRYAMTNIRIIAISVPANVAPILSSSLTN